MKEPDDDASTTDSAFGSCSVVTGSTFIGTLHSQKYQEVRKFVVCLEVAIACKRYYQIYNS